MSQVIQNAIGRNIRANLELISDIQTNESTMADY